MKHICLVAALAAAGPALAQDDLLEVIVDPRIAAERGAERGVFGARPDEQVLIGRLAGLRLIADASQVSTAPIAARATPGPTVQPGTFDFSAVDLPEEEVLALTVGGFIDQPVSIESLRRLETFIRVHLRAQGYPFYIVALPEQDITPGILNVVVQPSVLDGDVRVEGAEFFPEDQLRAALAIAPDAPISQTQLDAAAARLSRNPYRDVVAVAEAGATPGTTRVTLRTSERRPWTFSAGLTNTGTRATERERFSLGVQYGNFLGRGDLLSYRYSADPSSRHSVTHTLGSTHFLGLTDTLSLSASHTDSDSNLAPPFDQSGSSYTASAIWSRDLGGDRVLSFGLEVKGTDNTLRFSNTPVSATATQIVQAQMGYGFGFEMWGGQTRIDTQLFLSPGGVTGRNSDAAFNALRSGAQASYAYARVSARHDRALSDRLGLTVELTGQVASANLLSSEQLAAGGLSAVRGFEDNAAFGDHGLVARASLRLPPVAGPVQPSLFTDYAYVGSQNLLAGEASHIAIGSVGVAAQAELLPGVRLDAALGYRHTGRRRNSDSDAVGLNFNLSARF